MELWNYGIATASINSLGENDEDAALGEDDGSAFDFRTKQPNLEALSECVQHDFVGFI